MLTSKTITVNKYYYDKNNCRFVLCESCWWFATILKDMYKISYCPRCKKKNSLYMERILGISKNNNGILSNFYLLSKINNLNYNQLT